MKSDKRRLLLGNMTTTAQLGLGLQLLAIALFPIVFIRPYAALLLALGFLGVGISLIDGFVEGGRRGYAHTIIQLVLALFQGSLLSIFIFPSLGVGSQPSTFVLTNYIGIWAIYSIVLLCCQNSQGGSNSCRSLLLLNLVACASYLSLTTGAWSALVPIFSIILFASSMITLGIATNSALFSTANSGHLAVAK